MIRAISIQILSWLGWQIEKQYRQLPDKYVLIVIPHTSNWDFPIGLLARSALGLDIKYVGKSSLFRPPFGMIFRWLGGYPVDRSRSQGYVDSVIDLFNQHKEFAICIAPEGTRNYVDKLKTGFYHIARGAGIPIVMVQFDWPNKKIVVAKPFYPTGHQATDFTAIEAFYQGVVGRYPEKSYRHRKLEQT